MNSLLSKSLPTFGAIAAIAIALFALLREPTMRPGRELIPGLVEAMSVEGKIRAGYGVYPPYTQEAPGSGKVTGFSVDIVNEVARQLGVAVEWKRLNWNTMAADLKRGTFDMIADPIFHTIPRAREFAFTQPYAYFADGIALVRADDVRFQKFEDLDRPGVTIAVAKGIASETLLRARIVSAKISSVVITNDTLLPFNEVLNGRADVAVADGADASRFASEHAGRVKVLFLDNPPAFMPAGFALRYGDLTGAEFLNTAIRNLETTGVVDSLARRYTLPSYRLPGRK